MITTNRVTIIGNLTADPTSRDTKDGKNVCTFTVAVNRRQKNKDGKNLADYFRVSAWNQLGEACQKYLAKGRKVAVIGSVSVHAYSAEDGTPKASLEVTAQDVEFLGGGNNAQDETAQEETAPAEQHGGFTAVETGELPF